MSAAHVAMVLAHSRSKSVARLVAIGLADGYDVDANCAVASISELSRLANAAPAQVEQSLRTLVRLGEWAQVTRPDGLRVVRMTLGCPIDCDRTAMHRTQWDVPAPGVSAA